MDNKRGAVGAKGILIGIASLALLALLIFVVVPWAVEGVSKFTDTTPSEHPANFPTLVENIFDVTLGAPGSGWTWEQFIIRLVVFLVLFFAFSEIMAAFSTFSEATSWVIGFGLALLAGVARTVHFIAGAMVGTAAIGGLGIAVIILSAIVAAVLINLGFGMALKGWAFRRQAQVKMLKSMKGAKSVKSAIKGLKDIDTELASP